MATDKKKELASKVNWRDRFAYLITNELGGLEFTEDECNILLDYIEYEIQEEREKVSFRLLQSMEKLYKLWTPEPLGIHSPVNEFIKDIQDILVYLTKQESE